MSKQNRITRFRNALDYCHRERAEVTAELAHFPQQLSPKLQANREAKLERLKLLTLAEDALIRLGPQ